MLDGFRALAVWVGYKTDNRIYGLHIHMSMLVLIIADDTSLGVSVLFRIHKFCMNEFC